MPLLIRRDNGTAPALSQTASAVLPVTSPIG